MSIQTKTLLHLLWTRPRAQALDCCGELDRKCSQVRKRAGKVRDGAGADGGRAQASNSNTALRAVQADVRTSLGSVGSFPTLLTVWQNGQKYLYP